MSATKKLAWCALFLLSCWGVAAAKEVHHYVYFNRDRAKINGPLFLQTKAVEGAQLKYVWRELEPEQDRYDFSAIGKDLAFLSARGKKLFIQLQDVSFDGAIVNVPRYLLREARYNGGADRDYRIEGDDETRAVPAGWVARRWDAAVRERFHKLLFALGKEFDGRIAGINLPETAVEFGESGRLFPRGFTFEVYRAARAEQVAVGGPDLFPYRRGQMNHSYGLIRELDGIVPTGIAVQWGNYEAENPKTGKRTTIPELLDFATGYLKVDYIFWEFQEPFYTRDLMPFLGKLKGERGRGKG